MPIRVYYASPLFTMAERRFNRDLRDELCRLGEYEIYLPQEVDVSMGKDYIMEENLQQLNSADVVVGNCDGPIADDGTSYEIGYASAHYTPIVLFRTDLRSHEDNGFNLVFRDCPKVIMKCTDPLELLALKLHEKIQEVIA